MFRGCGQELASLWCGLPACNQQSHGRRPFHVNIQKADTANELVDGASTSGACLTFDDERRRLELRKSNAAYSGVYGNLDHWLLL
jgi:hypothetical protein